MCALIFDSFVSYLQVNHTSVVGMREEFLARGAAVLCIRETDLGQTKSHYNQHYEYESYDDYIFAFPAQVTAANEHTLPVPPKSSHGFSCIC